MASRQNLHKELTQIFPDIKVYYQPPGKMIYPCIEYHLDGVNTKKANNKLYKKDRRYVLTYYSLTPDPTVTIDGEELLVEDVMLNLPYCRFDRAYTVDNLHHIVFTIYY